MKARTLDPFAQRAAIRQSYSSISRFELTRALSRLHLDPRPAVEAILVALLLALHAW